MWQEYEARVADEFVLRGNAVLLKCALPSYVSDIVVIESWMSDQGETFTAADDWGKLRHLSAKIGKKLAKIGLIPPPPPKLVTPPP